MYNLEFLIKTANVFRKVGAPKEQYMFLFQDAFSELANFLLYLPSSGEPQFMNLEVDGIIVAPETLRFAYGGFLYNVINVDRL